MATIYASAQDAVEFRYGCIRYDSVLVRMPEYSRIDADLEELQRKFDVETKASVEEFNARYETFLAEQRNYAPSILRKRQQELEDMMHRNEQFRIESKRLLEQARKEIIQSLKLKIDKVISTVAQEYGLAFVINLDSDAVPFLNKDMAYDITNVVSNLVLKEIQQ